MRTGHIEKRIERRASFPPAANRQGVFRERAAHVDRTFDAGLAKLSERLVSADSDRVDTAIDTALELLGHAFEAHRIVYFTRLAPASPRHSLADDLFPADRVWTPESGVSAAASGTPPLPFAHARAAGLSVRETELESAVARGRGRVPIRRQHAVEVPTTAGPIGVLMIEGGLASARWSMGLFERAAIAGRLIGGAIERLDLARQVAASRAGRDHASRLECLGRVSSAVAHDLNNVLTAIQGYTDLIDMDLDEDALIKEDLGEISAAAHRAAGLIDQVLSFGRAREAKVERIDLLATLQGFEGLIARVLDRGIDFTLEGEPGLSAVDLDPGRFEPVVMNLASNAKAALDGRSGDRHFSIRVQAARIDESGREVETGLAIAGLLPGDYVRLTAQDDGCGVDSAIRQRIFEPFFTTKPTGEGTGLGLASMVEFVRDARGAIRLESEPEQGSEFHLYFPVAGPEPD